MPQDRVRLQGVHDLVPRDESPERHAAAEGLGQADDVGRHAVLLHGEEFARTPQSGLDLVEDEQRPHLVAAAPQRLEVSRLRRTHARLALHRFGQHAGRAFGDGRQGIEVIELDGLHIGQQRTEGTLPLLAFGGPHHRHRPVRRAVVCPPHGDQFGAARIAFGQLECTLDRLGPGVHEIDAFERIGQQRGNPCRILDLRRLDQLAVDHHVHVARSLLLHGPNDRRIGMADVAHRDTRHQIVVALALGRVEKRPLGPGHLDQHGRR